MAAGAPIVLVLGISAALTLALVTGTPLAVVPQRLYAGLDSFPIMAIPFFILAGLIMERGGIARRIVDLATALVGWIRGSLFGVATVTGTGLAAISGSGSADTAAISSIMIPEMRRRNYDIDVAGCLIAAAGTLAQIIPPSIMMVIVATIAGQSVGRMFLAGIMPGLLISLALLLGGYLFARYRGEPYTAVERFDPRRLGRATVAALPALTMPFIIVGGIVGGVFTPTEAACVAVLAGLLIGMVIYRELGWRDLGPLLLRAVVLSSATMMIIATASIFIWLIASFNVPTAIAEWLRQLTSNPLVFLLLVNLLLLMIGMIMESSAAILILVPVLVPIAQAYGIDPVHFSVVVVLNLSMGLITPPYGICLFVAATVAGRSMTDLAAKVWIPLVPYALVLALATYWPPLVTWLPDLVFN
jgi:C4-dicarboxylate transporter DctM subunit